MRRCHSGGLFGAVIHKGADEAGAVSADAIATDRPRKPKMLIARIFSPHASETLHVAGGMINDNLSVDMRKL